MYESPIQISTKLIDMNITDEIIKEIRFKTRIDISEEELIKALKYDRGQYDKGYADAMKDAQAFKERIQFAKPPEEPKKRKTYMEDFYEKFPNTSIKKDQLYEYEYLCVVQLYGDDCDGCDCCASCEECWNREMEE